MALPHPPFPLPPPTSTVRPKKRKVAAKTAAGATRQPSASTSAAPSNASPEPVTEQSWARDHPPPSSSNLALANEPPNPEDGSRLIASAVEDLNDLSDDAGSSASCATRSESPPPVRLPSCIPTPSSEVLPTTIMTTADSTRARSSAPSHPRLIIRIPSLAARRAQQQTKSPAHPGAPPAAQKRARSPTPDSEEDDFAASFMRKRRVSAALL